MKNIFYSLAAVFLFACNNQNSSNNTSGNYDDNDEGDVVVKRNTSITPSNAYNNFFLDTSVVSTYITNKEISGDEERQIRNFYNARNFQYAWFSTSGLTEELRNFWNAYTYSDSSAGKDKADKKLFAMLDTLLPATDTLQIDRADSSFINAELAVTRKFLAYMGADNNETNVERLIPSKKYDVAEFAKMVLAEKRDTGGMTKIEKQYDALKRKLRTLSANTPAAGDTIAFEGKLKKGGSSPALPAIKRKLASNGFLASTDTSAIFTDTTEQAVKSYQESLGVKPDGIISASLVKMLNVSPRQQLEQLLVNMNRLLWLPKKLPDHYILVNIPEFMLHTYEGDKKVFDMPVVVGREGTSTMMFSGDMNNVVFSPYWNLPESIVKNEVVPGIEKNSNYLASHNMEITGKRGDLPIVRQLPGPDNSLGKVKFLFPNSYDIYLHDTNAKYLFNRDMRAFSHGCIRLADAEKMANYILRNDSEWTAEKINEAMNSKEEKWVKLKEKEPVLIAYLTAWIDDDGRLTTRDDIYAHDAAAIGKLFTGK